MIIGISGKIGSGKDTIGRIIQYLTVVSDYKNVKDILKERNGREITVEEHFNSFVEREYKMDWKIKKYGGKLKDIVCILLGCTRDDLESHEFKDKELGKAWWYYHGPSFSNKSLISYNQTGPEIDDMFLVKLTPRKMLQLIGTECGRQIIHPNIWCNSLFSDYCGDIEEWKDINKYVGLYQISSFGNVRSLDREVIYGDKIKGEYHNRKGQLLKPTLSGGYETVSLCGKTFTVHSLVGEHFLNKSIGNFVLNHKDYDKTNNFYKNLEYVSQGDNVRHNYLTGNANIGIKQKDAKLSNSLVLQIKDWLASGKYSNSEIARRMNVSPTTISDIKKGRKWKHVGKEQIKIEPILPKPCPNWIITDVRFPNELQAVKDRDGISIRVNRGNQVYNEALPAHESETALDEAEFDYVIDNNGSISNLIGKVQAILEIEKII